MSKVIRTFLILIFTVVISCQPDIYKEVSLNLVKSGSSSYSIMLPEKPTQVESYAAEELQKYIREISGVTLQIGKHSDNKIYLGKFFAPLFDLSVESLKDGFEIKSKGNNLIIAGTNDRGTLYGVYELLEKIGCRWYAPNFKFYGEHGRDYIPKKENIKVEYINTREEAAFQYRTKNVEEGWSHNPENMVQLLDWMAKNRMNVLSAFAKHVRPRSFEGRVDTVAWDQMREVLIPEMKKRGIMVAVGGHGYQNYLPQEKYFDEYPDWFGMINGERTRNPHVVFNTANETALNTFISNIITYLKEHPEIDIFQLWPPDSETWSKDPESKKLGPPSVRHALLINQVAEVLKEEFPKLLLEFIAYRNYISPPEGIKFKGKNLLVDFCPYARSYQFPLNEPQSPGNTFYDKALQDWVKNPNYPGEVGVYTYYRKYIWRSLPVIIPHVIKSDIDYYHGLGINALSSYSEPADWLTYELNHYVIARLLWDPKLDVDSIIWEYTRLSFGKAGREMKEYFQLIEQSVPNANRIFQSELYPLLKEQRKQPIKDEFGTRRTASNALDPYLENLKKCEKLLNEARQKVESPHQRKWIQKIQLNLEYTIMDAQLKSSLMVLSEMGSKSKLQNVVSLTEKMRQFLAKHRDEGIILMNFYIRF